MNDLDFSGKTVLVVGGASGIGNGIAQAFRERGADVHVWGTRDSAAAYRADEGSGFEVLGVDRGRRDVTPHNGRFDDLRLLGRQCRGLAGRLRGGSARQRRGRRQRRQKKYVKPTVHSSISSFSSRLVNTT